MDINVLHLAHLTIGYGVERQLLDHLTLTKSKPNEIKHHVWALRISEPLLKELKSIEMPFVINRLWPWDTNKLAGFIKARNIHILHVHNQLRFPLRSRIIPKIAGVPFILEHEHGMVWNTSLTRMLKITNNLVNLSICNSNAARIMLKEKCGIEAKVVYNGVNLPSGEDNCLEDLKALAGLPDESKVVGFVGRLNTPKGVEAFIRIIPLVKKAIPQAKFVLIGDGPMYPELKELAKNLGVDGDVCFLGYHKKARLLMKQMDVIVVPSIREPFGNVVIEAALAKKPVVASNIDGIAETVIEGETGFLIDCTEPVQKRSTGASRLPKFVVDGRSRELKPPRLPDFKMMAEKVIECLQDPMLAASLGNKAYLRAIECFSFERYRNDLDDLYRELMSGL